jgi:hypothetical protein
MPRRKPVPNKALQAKKPQTEHTRPGLDRAAIARIAADRGLPTAAGQHTRLDRVALARLASMLEARRPKA